MCVSTAHMDLETLKLIINEQKHELDEKFAKENIIRREIQDTIHLTGLKQALVITGIRRCGKSTLAHLLLKKTDYGYINFDDERLTTLKTEEFNKVLEAFHQLYGDVKTIILDEVQNIPGWELFVNRIQRSKQIIITGSNSKLLSGELATHLTGRHTDIQLFPFSFKEFLTLKKISYDLYLTKDRAQIAKALNKYIERGGFPEGETKEYVRTLYNDVITKDIILRHNLKFRKAFQEFAHITLSNFAKEITYSSMRNAINVKSIHTAKNYLKMLEEAFLIINIPKFSFKIKEQVKEPKKTYVLDTGIINAMGFKFSENKGRLYENIVCTHLMRIQSQHPELEIYYYKDYQGHEKDFLIKEKAKVKEHTQACE